LGIHNFGRTGVRKDKGRRAGFKGEWRLERAEVGETEVGKPEFGSQWFRRRELGKTRRWEAGVGIRNTEVGKTGGRERGSGRQRLGYTSWESERGSESSWEYRLIVMRYHSVSCAMKVLGRRWWQRSRLGVEDGDWEAGVKKT
jgi:hypothetical protein